MILLAAAACAAISGSAPLLHGGGTVLIGEMHGSVEIPAAVGALACAAAQGRVPVTVALEWPVEDGAAIEAWLSAAAGAGGGAAADDGAPPRTGFWTRDYQDGRSSKAMLRLLQDLRALRRSGAQVRVAPMDPFPKDLKLRDGQMADRVAATRKERPRDLLLLLIGNLHNRRTIGVEWDAKYRPMAWHLAQKEVRFVSLDATYKTGTVWVCGTADKSSCGAREVHGKDLGAAMEIKRAGKSGGPYDGTLYVGAITASPPANR